MNLTNMVNSNLRRITTMNFNSDIAVKYSAALLCLIILSFCLSMSGCVRHKRHLYTPPRVYDHHCEDGIKHITPPAIIVTPTPRKPWFRRHTHTPVVPAPVLPFETDGNTRAVPQSMNNDEEEIEDMELIAVTAYAVIDKKCIGFD